MERARTFAELAAEVTAERPVIGPGTPADPGTFDHGGGLTDPGGRPLERVGGLSPKEAREALDRGALLAFEGCGCGGYVGCQPAWVDQEERSRLVGRPRCGRRHDTPGRIELWRGDGVEVVLACGDVRWRRSAD